MYYSSTNTTTNLEEVDESQVGGHVPKKAKIDQRGQLEIVQMHTSRPT